MRRAAALAIALWACGALLSGSASAHSLVRPAGAVVSYLSADATSLNTLQVRVSGNRIEFRDESVDGGMALKKLVQERLSFRSLRPLVDRPLLRQLD